jgi:Ran GTPase-activating protein (RanGAP) involved in mRNA processing and transport
MAFGCTRPKTKDDLYRNIQLEKRIDKSSTENIELINMNLTDQDIPIIIQKVIKKKKCTSLSLATNKITADGIRMIVSALKTNKKLTHLILASNPIGDEGIKYIIDLIENSRTLYHLSLSDTQITDDGMKMITDTLKSNPTSLRCIDLRSNVLITDVSVESLLQMVELNETLSACRLDNCGLSQDGKDKLKEVKSIKW